MVAEVLHLTLATLADTFTDALTLLDTTYVRRTLLAPAQADAAASPDTDKEGLSMTVTVLVLRA